MKHIITLFTVFVFALAIPNNMKAYSFSYTYQGQTLYYNIVNGNAQVTYQNTSSPRYSDLTGAVVIPNNVTNNGTTYAVTSIGEYAFYGCSGMTSVTIGSGIKTIGNKAFNGCNSLATVAFNADSCTSVGSYNSSSGYYPAFYNLGSITSFTFGNNVKSIPSYLCYGLSGLTSVTIPNSVKYMSDYAFYGCSGLTSVSIGTGITNIRSYDFYNCSSLASVTIPDNVTSISEYAFYGCSGMTSVTIGSGIKTIGNKAFNGCNSLATVVFNADSCTSVGSYNSSSGYYPAFYNLGSITSFTFGNNVKSIPSYLCYGLSGLTSVTIPNSVKYMGDHAFYGCSGLTSVSIGTGITNIRSYDFYNCSSLASVTIPDNVTSISEYAFYGCSGMTSVTIGSGIKTIGNKAFNGCNSLATVVFNADSCTSVGSYNSSSGYYPAFYNLGSITSFTFGNNVKSIPSYLCYGLSGLTSVTIPNSVKYMSDHAFYGCSGLTSVSIGTGITNIRSYDFYNCSSLASVTIPDNVTSISEYAFYGCSGMTSVTIGSGIKTIGNKAFNGCNSLATVVFNADSCTSVGSYNSSSGYYPAFYNLGSITSFILGNNIKVIPDYLCYGLSGLNSITIPTTVISIGNQAFSGCSGLTVVMFNADSCLSVGNNSPAFYNLSNITNFTFGDNVKSIPNNLCYGLSGLTSITIPNTVVSIGSNAFRGCSGVTMVSIPNSVKTIGASAFSNCSGMTSLTIGQGVESIDYYAFDGCTNLTSVAFNADSCTYVGVYNYVDIYHVYYPAFYNPSSITSFTFGNNVKSIPSYLCYGLSGLTSVTIPNSVKYMGDYAFYGCSGLTSVSIGSGITNIRAYDFYNCSSLASVTIPDNVTSISDYAFYNCSGMASVTIGSGIKTIGNRAFNGCNSLATVAFNADSCTSVGNYNSSNNYYPAFYNLGSITSFTFGNNVKSIPSYLCYGLSGLTSVTIPNSVKYMGDHAFYGCSGLTSVSIGTGITNIRAYDFYNCRSLASITIPDNVTSISDYAFYNCSGMASVTIGSGIKTIGNRAFNGCNSLATVAFNADSCTSVGSYNSSNNYYPAFYNLGSITFFTFGNNVKSIPSYLCYGLSGLISITIPNNVTSIGDYAFQGCSGMTSLTIGSGIKTIGNKAFNGCNSLATVTFNADSCTSVGYISSSSYYPAFYNLGSITSFTFGNNVKSIPSYLCYGLSGLTSVTIPNSVKYMGDYAFYGCSGLTSVSIGTGITNIRSYDFYNCSSLASVTIPDNVTSIGNYAFYNCSGLASISIPNNVISIGSQAFGNCSNLASVAFNADSCVYAGGTSGNRVFYGCSNIANFTFGNDVNIIPSFLCYGLTGITSISIPESVDTIGKEAFNGCPSLTTVNYYAKNMSNLSYESNGTTYYYTPFNLGSAACMTTLNIGGNVKRIPGGIFYNQTALTSISIPNSVQNIGPLAFMNCTGLNGHLTIPTSVKTIDNKAFSGCNGLVSVTLPDSVTSIGNETFNNCHLDTLVVGRGLTYIGTDAFKNNTPKFLNYDCPANIASAIPKNNLRTVIVGDHVTNIYSYAFSNCTTLTSLTIGRGVRSIGNQAFYGCAGLTSVAFNADSCTSAGSYNTSYGYYPAFYNLSNITSFSLGNNVKIIPDFLCYGLSGLTSITIPDSVTRIGDNSFYGASGLNTLTIPNSVTYIGSSAFSEMSGLTSITIPNSVTYLGNSAFYNCSSITSASIGSGISSINYNTFYNCSGLTSISIPNQVSSIESSAFYGCSSLASVTIPNTVTSIGSYAFYGCSNLSTITLGEGISQIGSACFHGCSSLDSITIHAQTAPNIGFSNWNGYNVVPFHKGVLIKIPCGAFENYVSRWSMNDDQIAIPDVSLSTYYYWSTWSKRMLQEPVVDYVFTAIPNDTTRGEVGVEYNGVWYYSSAVPHSARCIDSTVHVKAFPATHYHLDHWSTGETAQIITVRLTSDSTITAFFALDSYNLSLSSNNANQGTVSGGGWYNYLDTATITATGINHYHFSHWNDGNRENPRRVVITNNLALTAYFVIDTYTVAVVSNNETRGFVRGGGSFVYGEPCTVEATAYTGYTFAGWSNGITANPYIFRVEDNVELTALFIVDGEETYTVTAASADATMGTATVNGSSSITAVAGQRVTLIAIPFDGYRFSHWNDNSTNATHIVTVTADANYIAYFERIGTSEGINNVDEEDKFLIYSNNGTIMVCGAEGEKISVFDITGRLIFSQTANQNLCQINIQQHGLYLVKIRDLPVRKVVVLR